MGNCGCGTIPEKVEEDPNIISLKNIIKSYPIGRGGFGKVWLIKMKGIQNFKKNARLEEDIEKFQPGYEFALKEMSKAKIVKTKSIESIRNERKFLEYLNHPLLVNMQFAFEANDNLYLIMDYLSGGDLRYNISQVKYFSEEQVKFIVACIVLVLEYIRSKHILHRDLKPENLVFDKKGYVHLTDFGIAFNSLEEGEINDSSGTPGYMAPEVFLHTPQDSSVDYFSLGVITHELMLKRRPYGAIERKGYKEEVLSREIKLKPRELPTQRGWTDESVIDFINGLLKRKPKERLGYKDISEIIHHPWLKDVDWNGIYYKTVEAPFHFNSQDNFDAEYARKDSESDFDSQESTHINLANKKKYFRDYYFNRFEKLNEIGGRRMRKSMTTRDVRSTGLSSLFTKHTSKPVEEENQRKKVKRRSTYINKYYRNILEGINRENKEEKKEEEEDTKPILLLNLKDNEEKSQKDTNKQNEQKLSLSSNSEKEEYVPVKKYERKGGMRKSVLPAKVNRNKMIDDLQ